MAKVQRSDEAIKWQLTKQDGEGDFAVVDRRTFSVQISGGPVTLLGRVSPEADFVLVSDRRGVPILHVGPGILYVDLPLNAVQPKASDTATVTVALSRH